MKKTLGLFLGALVCSFTLVACQSETVLLTRSQSQLFEEEDGDKEPLEPVPNTGSLAGILSSDRVVEWQGNVGVKGGIPYYPCATDLPASASAATVNEALENTEPGSAVCLGKGTGTWSDLIVIPSGVVLRGAGLDANGVHYTKISSSNDWPSYVRLGHGGWKDPETCVALSANVVKGSNQLVTATQPSCLSEGSILILNQANDTSLVNSDGEEGEGTRIDAGRDIGELVKVTKIEGSGPYTITIQLPASYPYKTARSAALKSVGYGFTSFNGLEDLQLTGVTHANEIMGRSVDMTLSSNAWMKNVKLVDSIGGSGVLVYVGYRNEVRDSWFSDATYYGAGRGYAASLYHFSTANLFENNVFEKWHSATVVNYGGAYNVFGYNHILYGKGDSKQAPGISTHGVHAYMNLWEGNYTEEKVLFDFTHGSGSHQTVFRNRILGKSQDANVKTYDQVAVHLAVWNRYVNFLGNVLGVRGYHTALKGDDFAVWDLKESPAVGQYILHGNHSYCSGTGCNTTEWDPAISKQELPSSLYLDARPEFFGNLSWPAYGPNPSSESAGNIPAKHCYGLGKMPNCLEP